MEWQPCFQVDFLVLFHGCERDLGQVIKSYSRVFWSPCFGAEENDGEGFDPGDVGTRDYDDATDQSGKRHAPRAGNWDGRQHIGEGPWDGGSGGTGTATWQA